MKYKDLFQSENEQVMERYELAMERVEQIPNETSVQEPYRDYFIQVANFICEIKKLYAMVVNEELEKLSLAELELLNKRLYEDIIGENYNHSYANPAYATEKLGTPYGKILAFLYTEIRGFIPYAYECRLTDITIYLELFIEIYNTFEEEDEYTHKDIKKSIYYFVSDYLDVTTLYRIRELVDPDLSFAKDIIMNWDLTDLRYLYQFGEYITTNEIETAKFLNSLSEEEVKAMADTYTSGYARGFEIARIDLSEKKTVGIRYRIGFERMLRYAIENFRAMGLEPIIYRYALNSVNKRQHLKIGYSATSPNRQYDYDHRFDNGLYLDKAFVERRLVCTKQAYETYKTLAKDFAGPAVIEIFGETTFYPENKEDAITLDEKQQKLYATYNRDNSILTNEYMDSTKTSFTIISYPIPEIGERFKEIFADTVKVNTLDNDTYNDIQQIIIDTLDSGDYVHILGSGENKTDLVVKLYELKDRDKETIFENCTANVNIPVGEVFTSPMLTGTNGVLHVTKVFLNGLEYRDLSLTFENGKIAKYSCKNFDNEAANQKFVKENLLYNNDTLPMGEFAIGTNTTAYVMGRKYDINDKLPILIAEKTGPHFAVGDTCYKMSEDHKVYNPDGKEIVARDNEVSILRKTDMDQAYFSCHTDITIPYDELLEISVFTKAGEKTEIIRDGRFVLPGTEFLNEAFKEM